MKLSSPPSVSSSTSSAFTGIFPTTRGSVSGCLSFVLRAILCSTKLPTHPSDQLQETAPIEHSMNPHNPNLVARLMGLDSMPESPSIARSKSMNSADCRAGETGEVQGHHRRVKTSVSFREAPSFFELEDDDFFVISFENGGDNKKTRSKNTKSEAEGRGIEQRRRRRREQGRRPRFKISEEDSTDVLVLEIENCDRFKSGRDGRKKEDRCSEGAKFETESESENSSPVSVLDHSSFISDHEAPTSEEETRNRSSSPRRKLVSEMSNLGNPSTDPNNGTCPKEDDKKPSEATKGKQATTRRKRCRKQRNTEVAAAEMADWEGKCKGGVMNNLKFWEAEIGVELGLQIVEQLVDEMVDELISSLNL